MTQDGAIRKAKRLARRTLDQGSRIAGGAVDALRRGDRVLLDAPPHGMRLGNFLYLWLQVHLRRAAGESISVRESRGMEQWCDEFPALRALTADASEIRFSDRREWDGAWLYQRFGTDFTRDQLQVFIGDVFRERVPAGDARRLVINIRRGDFYGTEFEAKHGFDIVPFVDAALDRFPDAEGTLVVSDDPHWCRRTLDSRLRAHAGTVDYAAQDPLDNLLALGSARLLIGANSTFSYWGAYIADAMHPDARIVMPRFHARMPHGSDAHQLDPRWIALDGFDGFDGGAR
ncbi:hypothetical protein DY023_01830 [Microbacterium bovistercoris]|uniref:Alpha-1,2-fucosyltransferase n=1 Tax=Microbacterium bovistercoris TaxID=2293570 RepID=A0A371NXX2_9MICO|nr:alpha-1,2-fucosyltransferase [Microbacterium bovistercoris]REJ08028.1 hypothetical protein DY023_01830 [Microbacterium bovistercoris]